MWFPAGAQNEFCIGITWQIRNRIRKNIVNRTGAQIGMIDEKKTEEENLTLLSL
jgi:hypothetical protein